MAEHERPARSRVVAAVDPRAWALWGQRPRLVWYAVAVEAAAVAWNVADPQTPAGSHQWRIAALIIALGIGQAELSRQVERLRRGASGEQPYINMTSVWTFAAVLLLPNLLITCVVAAIYAHLAVRSWRGLRRVPPYRSILNASMVVLTCLVAHQSLRATGFDDFGNVANSSLAGLCAVALAVAVYFLVGAALVVPALRGDPRSFTAVLGTWSENFLEFSTLCVGALIGAVIVVLPSLSVAVLPLLILVQRSMLVTQLEVEATTDAKTGVLNTSGWYARAERQLVRVRRAAVPSLAILMVDLDHFKAINDRFGHLAGDEVLKRVAATLAAEVRDSDGVGRFGGEEFVIQLPHARPSEAWIIAERIRGQVAALVVETVINGEAVRIDGLSASIGVSTFPDSGATLEELVQAADTALYGAKRDGRNRVVAASAA